MSAIEFWFEFASSYSYLSAMRIEEMAEEAGLKILWKPFLLGPIFKSQGWDTSPFNLFPKKCRYMVRDIGRIAESRGLVFQLPSPFPQNSLTAARLSLTGIAEGWAPHFVRAIYAAQFAEGQNIAERSTLSKALRAAGVDPDSAFKQAETPAIKAQLRANTEEAQAKGIFGAPSFVTKDGELFWGDDRLEAALYWTKSR